MEQLRLCPSCHRYLTPCHCRVNKITCYDPTTSALIVLISLNLLYRYKTFTLIIPAAFLLYNRENYSDNKIIRVLNQDTLFWSLAFGVYTSCISSSLLNRSFFTTREIVQLLSNNFYFRPHLYKHKTFLKIHFYSFVIVCICVCLCGYIHMSIGDNRVQKV